MPLSSRRSFIKGGAALSTTALSSSSIVATLSALQTRQAQAAQIGQSAPVASPYGPIAPVADNSTGLPLLQLPEGFEYCSFGWTGDPMDNGLPTPGSHDGMAVIYSEPRGRDVDVVLVRNHERGGAASPIQAPAIYDSTLLNGSQTAGGGTTNLVFRGRTFRGSYASLGGTLVNCAGGPTPWGTWLTCEEILTAFGEPGQPGKKHGYVFEVRKEANATTGKPIVAMGRFQHEAVAIDPQTKYAYLTEDLRNASGLYRFIPNDTSGTPGSYEQGGKLQMARVKGQPNADLIVASQGASFALEWVDIGNPDAPPYPASAVTPTLNPASPLVDYSTAPNSFVAGCFAEGWGKGALRMSRGEGIWYHRGKMYIVDTSTGLAADGRRGRGAGAVWELDLATDTLRAIFVSLNQLAADNPDNVTVSPRGGIVLCEDGGGATDPFGFGSRLLGLTAQGESYIFCKNNVLLDGAQIAAAGKLVSAGNYRGSEFCGACFDPAGKVMFVNIQSPGITFAIWGPWKKGNL